MEVGACIWQTASSWLQALLDADPKDSHGSRLGVVHRIKGYVSICATAGSDGDGSQHSDHGVEQVCCDYGFVVDGVRGSKLRIQRVEKEHRRSAATGADHHGSSSSGKLGVAYAEEGIQADAAPKCKLFVFGIGLSQSALEDKFRECMVPENYSAIADLEIDFPPFVREYHKVHPRKRAKTHAFTDNNWKHAIRVELDGRPPLAIFWVRGKFYALDADCPHLGGPLELGDVEDWAMCGAQDTVAEPKTGETAALSMPPTVSCPTHLFVFQLDTGKGLTMRYDAKPHNLRLVGTTLFVENVQ